MDAYKEIAAKVPFGTFQRICPYNHLAFDDPDDHTRLYDVCDINAPQFSSWGKCCKEQCPYYGEEIVMNNIVAYNESGEKIFTADSGIAKITLEGRQKG